MPPPPPDAAQQRRDAIVQAALAHFFHFGYRRTSMDDVARACGVAKGTLYLYFKSKKALFRGTIEHTSRSILARAEAALETASSEANPSAALEARLFAALHAQIGALYALSKGSAHLMDIMEAITTHGSDVWEAHDRAYEALLTAYLTRAEEAGDIALGRLEMSAAEVARALVTCAQGAKHPPLGGDPSEEALEARLRAIVRVMCRGLSA